MLSGVNEKAKSQTDCAEKSAANSYLKAIIAARMDDASGVASNLKEAVSADAIYRKDALSDLEFKKYWESSDFKGAIQ